MKRNSFVFILLLGISLFTLSPTTSEEERFYYAFDEKVPLKIKPNTILVKYVEGTEKTQIEESVSRLTKDYTIKWHSTLTAEITVSSQKLADELADNLKQDNKVYTCQPFYTLKDGLDMGVTDEILVRFLPGVNENQKKELQEFLDLSLIKITNIYQKYRVPRGTDALAIANKIYESGLVEFATPNFISYAEFHQLIPNDTYFNRQITCHNTGQVFTDGHSGTNDADIDAPEAWTLTTGSSDIIIAVLDQGVTSNHPDLPNTRQIRLNGSNFGNGDPNNPSPINNENHGNACAGVIAATMNNSQGITGIAPNCRIMPIRLPENFNPDIVADAIEFAVDNGADILSNSWGYLSADQNLHPVIVAAINYALTNNRVVIFSAGNTANHVNNNDGFVCFPANVNIPGVITVGASDRYDMQANYSPTSNLIDIVAPSHRAYPTQISGETFEMWTIDIPGNTGYNPYPASMPHPPATGEILPNSGTNYLAYTARFGGTSHSCPVIAGVAALMLSVNPNLTPIQVFNILTTTADKVGGYTYTDGRCNQMGFGRINAYAAVQAVPKISGSTVVCSQGSAFTINSVPSGSTILWSCGPYLTRVSSQGSNPCTFSSTGSGSSWIGATIYTSGGDSIILPHYNVWSGLPQVWQVTGPSEGCFGSEYTFYAYYPNYPNPTSFEWTISPEYYCNTIYGYDWWANAHFDCPYEEYYQVRCTPQNACGTGNMVNTYIYIYDCGYGYSLSPNPASTEVTVTVTRTDNSLNNMAVENTIFDISIYDNYGVKYFQNKYSGDRFTIPVYNLKNGNYILKIDNGKSVVNKQLIIMH